MMERIFRLTPNGVLTAYTEWLPGVRLRHSAPHIEDCELGLDALSKCILTSEMLRGFIKNSKIQHLVTPCCLCFGAKSTSSPVLKGLGEAWE